MSEAQSNSYEALAENFEAFQRRTVGFAQGGFGLLRFREGDARAAQELRGCFGEARRLTLAGHARSRGA
jgi:hypothetical protein